MLVWDVCELMDSGPAPMAIALQQLPPKRPIGWPCCHFSLEETVPGGCHITLVLIFLLRCCGDCSSLLLMVIEGRVLKPEVAQGDY